MGLTEQTIDFVVTYVDNSDPVWLEKKSKYTPQRDKNLADDREIRFRSWDNLKYWFRSVEQFCPWVRKIFFVTDNQIPAWLNTDNEKLEIICHEDYIPEEYLPVFSSHPIEFFIHKIKGLSDRFVYFNDDMFVLRPLQPTDFFIDGLPCDYAIESPPLVYDQQFAHICANNALALNRRFDRKAWRRSNKKKIHSFANKRGFYLNFLYGFFPYKRFFGFENAHVGAPFLKQSFKDAWELFHEEIDSTCRHRFRNDQDVNQYLIQQYQFIKGNYHPTNIARESRMFRLTDGAGGNIDEAEQSIKSQAFKMICLNEAEVTDFEAVKKRINKTWEDLLPEKSSFEK